MAYFFPQAEKLFPKLAKKALLLAVTVPEAIIMLIVAGILDLIGLVLFILSLAGVGIPISFGLDLMGIIVIGGWTLTRSFVRPLVGRVAEKVTEKVTKMAVSVGKTPGEPTPTSSPAAELGGKIGKKGIQIGKRGVLSGLGIIATIGALIIELIPFVGDILPMWTLRVLYELATGTISDL